MTVIADRFEGRRFNSPNDVVVQIRRLDLVHRSVLRHHARLRGRVWRGGDRRLPCLPRRSGDRRSAQVADDFAKPNGLAFSPDETLLYVADTGASHLPDGPRHIRRFKVGDAAALSGGEVFAECTNGLFDGFRVDSQGRLWCSAGDGVHCYDPDGTLIGKIHIPEAVSNLTFGGARRNRLFITATTSLYAVYVTANGSTLG